MKKTISGAIFAAGLALGAGGVSVLSTPSVYAHGLNVARLPKTGGGHSFATGNVYAADFSDKGKPAELGSRRIVFTPDEEACLNGVLDRASALFSSSP